MGVVLALGFAGCSSVQVDGPSGGKALRPPALGACSASCAKGKTLVPRVVAEGQARPSVVHIDEYQLYWANAGTTGDKHADSAIFRAPLSGGKATLVAASGGRIRDFVVTETYVYFVAHDASDSGSGHLARVPKSGGAVEKLDLIWEPRALLRAGSALYLGMCCGAPIVRWPLEPYKHSEGLGYAGCVRSLGVRDGWLYWDSTPEPYGDSDPILDASRHIGRVSLDGATTEAIAAFQAEKRTTPMVLAADAGFLAAGGVMRFGLAKGAGIEEFTAIGAAALAIDATQLFLSGDPPGIVTLPLAGGYPEPLVPDTPSGALDFDPSTLAWAEPGAADQATGRILVAAR